MIPPSRSDDATLVWSTHLFGCRCVWQALVLHAVNSNHANRSTEKRQDRDISSILRGTTIQELGLVVSIATGLRCIAILACLLLQGCSIATHTSVFNLRHLSTASPEFHMPRYLLFPLQQVARCRISKSSDETALSRIQTRPLVKMLVVTTFGSLRVICDSV